MTVVMDLPAAGGVEPRAAQLSYTPALSLGVLRAVALSIIAMKLVFSAIVPPGFDDAYYWLWGQHLQWSYLDHAPMVGWGSWVGYHLLGWNALGMHFLPLVSFALSVLVMRSWAKRIVPDHWQHYFWAMLAVFLASPLLMAISTILYPDQALMAASLGALHFLALFLADWRAGTKRYRNLYIGAVLVGLAMLSKYNGALIGLGFFAAILADPRLRTLLKSKHLYFAALVAALCLLPIVGWNIANDFASLKLHTSDRFVRGDRGFSWNGPLRFLPQTALYFSPFLIWPLFRSLVARRVPGPEGAVVVMGRWIFLASTLALAVLASWGPASTQVAPHWEIVAFMPFVLLAPLFIRSRWLMGLHLGFGTIVAALAVAYYLSAPLLTNALGIADTEASHNYGQDQLAAAIGKEEWANGASFVAARRYTLGAKLSYGAGTDQGIISISPEIDGFYFWHDLKALAGKSAIILSEDTIGPDGLSDEFTTVTSLGSFTPQRFGQPIGTYYLYLGRGFHGKAPVP